MDQVKYQGYAQRTAFDPIKVPDQTARILAEGERTIRGMQAVRNQERENRDAYLSGLQRKNQLEEQNRESNYNLDKSFRDKYQQAVRQNYQIKIEDASRQAGNIEKVTGSLTAFSQTLAKTFGEYQEKKNEADELAGFQAVKELGITLEEYNALKAGEAKLDAFDQATNGIVQQLQERGASAEQIARIRGLSGRKLYGAMKAFAIQGADNYPLFRAENQDREFEINGQMVSLNTARNAGPEMWAAVNAQLSTEYLKQFRGMDPKFLSEYLFKGMRDTENQEKISFANDRSKALAAQFQEEQTNQLVTDWKAGGAQGVMDWITRTSGGTSVGLRNQRLAALKHLETLAEVGQFTASDYEELAGYGVTLKGSSTPKAFGDLYTSDLSKLKQTIENFNKKQYENDRFTQEQSKQEAITKLHDYVTQNGPLSNEEKKAYEEYWRQTFHEFPPADITKFISSEEMADQEAERILKAKADANQLTTLELNNGRYSAKLRQQYRQFAKDGDIASKEFVTSIKKSVDAAIGQQLNQINLNADQRSSEFYMMQALSHQDLDSRASIEMRNGATPEAAYQKASYDIQADIKANKGRYALKMVNGQPSLEGGYQIFSTSGQAIDQKRRFETIRSRAVALSKNGLNPFVQPGLFGPGEIKQIEAVGHGAAIPAIIYGLNKLYPKLTPWEIMDMAMESVGKPPITKPSSAAVYDMVRPEFRSLLTFNPSLSRTIQGLSMSAGPGAPYKQVLDLIASKESSNDTVHGGYDSFNTGGTDDGMTPFGSNTGTVRYGRPLTQMTVGEIMNLQNQRGGIHAVGRYQIIGPTLANLINNGAASRSDKFDEATQDRLAIKLLYGRAGKFFSGEVNASSVIQGMGDEWRGLRHVDPKIVAAALTAAKSNLNNPNFDPSRMRSSIVYKVGGIGPNGPNTYGPHLDIKQDNGKFFSRTNLDNYIGFQTATGVIPVSAGQTVDGGHFGASRDYGSHNGWDYAMPAGTKVVLRNGAWIAGKVKTDYGDKLTIALPDGRRFNIIHGTAV